LSVPGKTPVQAAEHQAGGDESLLGADVRARRHHSGVGGVALLPP